MADFVRIGEHPHDWNALVADWDWQTQQAGEVFDEEYQLLPDIFRPLIARNDARAGLFAVYDNGHYDAICQINVASIPGYSEPVLRVRYVTFGPRIDLTNDESAQIYSSALVETFFSVITLASGASRMKAGHVHFHLPSPSDRQFFGFVGQKFRDRKLFELVESKGAWLYITL